MAVRNVRWQDEKIFIKFSMNTVNYHSYAQTFSANYNNKNNKFVNMEKLPVKELP